MENRLIANVRVVRRYEFTGAELRRLRVAGDLSEKDLAAVLGVSRKQVQRLQKRLRVELSHSDITVLLKAVGATMI